jgi:hypothetical protein
MARLPGITERARRIDLRRSAVLIDSDGSASEVTVLDVSSGGLRLDRCETLRIGELVTLRVEHGEAFPIEIRWTLGTEAGAVFLGPIAESRGGVAMTKSDTDRRTEPREGEDRRQSGDRRQADRDQDRRKGDRRNGDPCGSHK